MNPQLAHPVLYSGGAIGSDTEWARHALLANHHVIVCSFRGHNLPANHPIGHLTIQKYNKDDFLKQREGMLYHAKSLGRTLPASHTYVYKLLTRSLYIIQHCTSVYAIGFLKTLHPAGTSIGVDGGTGWGCQMFANHNPQRLGLIPMYLFVDQQSGIKGWHQCYHISAHKYRWQCMTSPPPPPSGCYAGIGARDITPTAIQAIAALYEH